MRKLIVGLLAVGILALVSFGLPMLAGALGPPGLPVNGIGQEPVLPNVVLLIGADESYPGAVLPCTPRVGAPQIVLTVLNYADTATSSATLRASPAYSFESVQFAFRPNDYGNTNGGIWLTGGDDRPKASHPNNVHPLRL